MAAFVRRPHLPPATAYELGMPTTPSPQTSQRRLVDADLRIGNRLVRDGLITNGQLAEALAAQKTTGRKIVETLIALGSVTDTQFVRFLAQ